MKKIIIASCLIALALIPTENKFRALKSALEREDLTAANQIVFSTENPILFIEKHSKYCIETSIAKDAPGFLSFFLGFKVGVHCIDDNGYTPLMNSAMHNQIECIKLLLRNGVDVNYQTSQGETALHLAAHCNKYEAVEILLQHGANLLAKTKDNATPYSMAKTYKSFDDPSLFPLMQTYYRRMLETNSKKLALIDTSQTLKGLCLKKLSLSTKVDYCRVALLCAALSGDRTNGINNLNYVLHLPPADAEYEAIKYLYKCCFPETGEFH